MTPRSELNDVATAGHVSQFLIGISVSIRHSSPVAKSLVLRRKDDRDVIQGKLNVCEKKQQKKASML